METPSTERWVTVRVLNGTLRVGAGPEPAAIDFTWSGSGESREWPGPPEDRAVPVLLGLPASQHNWAALASIMTSVSPWHRLCDSDTGFVTVFVTVTPCSSRAAAGPRRTRPRSGRSPRPRPRSRGCPRETPCRRSPATSPGRGWCSVPTARYLQFRVRATMFNPHLLAQRTSTTTRYRHCCQLSTQNYHHRDKLSSKLNIKSQDGN